MSTTDPASPSPLGPTWPLFDLELRTPRLVLRTPRDADLPALLDSVDAGIHDPDFMPFSNPWTDAEPGERRRSSLQHWWGARAGWSAGDWHLPLAAFFEGTPVGVQAVLAKDFPVLREVTTGSWLSRSVQGVGLGKEMRAAVLEFAFGGIGALVARSGAFVDNPSSLGVSRALGYEENGTIRLAPRGEPRLMVNYVMTRERWTSVRSGYPPTEVTGLAPCLPMFGLG